VPHSPCRRRAQHDVVVKIDPVDAVAFDIGGVFLDWDPHHLYRQLIPDTEARERFFREICSPEWHAEQDLGRSIVESCSELARHHPEYASLISAWAERNEEMVAGVIEGSVEILRELRDRNVPCYMLTNMEQEAFVARRSRYAFMSDFDGCVVSSDEGVAKPDVGIFLRLLSRFGLVARRTLFVDDSVANAAAAAFLGFRVCLFTSPAQLREVLVECQLLDVESE
jgi:2-haloacid dehalogenase